MAKENIDTIVLKLENTISVFQSEISQIKNVISALQLELNQLKQVVDGNSNKVYKMDTDIENISRDVDNMKRNSY